MREMRDMYLKEIANLRQQLARKRTLEEQGNGEDFVPDEINFDPSDYTVDDVALTKEQKSEHEAELAKQ